MAENSAIPATSLKRAGSGATFRWLWPTSLRATFCPSWMPFAMRALNGLTPFRVAFNRQGIRTARGKRWQCILRDESARAHQQACRGSIACTDEPLIEGNYFEQGREVQVHTGF